MPRNQQFEIPQELRQLAEDNVEHARKLYLQFMEGISQAWLTPSADRVPPGFNEIRERAINLRERMRMPPSTWQEMLQTLRTCRNW